MTPLLLFRTGASVGAEKLYLSVAKYESDIWVMDLEWFCSLLKATIPFAPRAWRIRRPRDVTSLGMHCTTTTYGNCHTELSQILYLCTA